jgi:hypothetical protein
VAVASLVTQIKADHGRLDVVVNDSFGGDRDGVTDTDGSRPDAWGDIATYGMAEQRGRDVERFR